jgi:hypothetical protein
MNKLTSNPFVQGVGLALLTLIPVFVIVVATFRPGFFVTRQICQYAVAILWITGLLLLVLDRLIEFDFLKGLLKGKLSSPSPAAELADATRSDNEEEK